MRLGAWARQWVLGVHVVSSIGWLGAVASFLLLTIYGLASASADTAQGVYKSCAIITEWLIVPLCVASTASGVLQAMGTPWGLVRHYWIVIKLAVTGLSAIVLFVHLSPIEWLATRNAAQLLAGDGQSVRLQLLIDGAAALLVLLVVVILSIVKPRGQTVAH